VREKRTKTGVPPRPQFGFPAKRRGIGPGKPETPVRPALMKHNESSGWVHLTWDRQTLRTCQGGYQWGENTEGDATRQKGGPGNDKTKNQAHTGQTWKEGNVGGKKKALGGGGGGGDGLGGMIGR